MTNLDLTEAHKALSGQSITIRETDKPLTGMQKSWIFLGDSLTEGVGSSRASFFTDLGQLMRSEAITTRIHMLKVRPVNPDIFNAQLKTNLAVFEDRDTRNGDHEHWLFNLASEASTASHDKNWECFARLIRPELTIIFRGNFESILRPAAIIDGKWPWWVPVRWRNHTAMNPRCYFSSTFSRKWKQVTEDAIKQKIRLKLFENSPGAPLMSIKDLISELQRTISFMKSLGSKVLVCGLLPVSDLQFPGSASHFRNVNIALGRLAEESGSSFFDWGSKLPANALDTLYYRDGFHPNQAGSRELATLLHAHLKRTSFGEPLSPSS